jgi:DNA replication and repair protein RecF
LARELAERRAADLERGFTAHGPHRDDVQLLLDAASLRAFGSQGQQRVALLALLFAERELLSERRGRPPLMLLDDVMSELDAERRELLAELLRSGGQAVVTTADVEHVPSARDEGTRLLEVAGGRLSPAAVAA